MNKSFYLFIALCVPMLAFSSCEETKEVDQYANWQARNTEFNDSLQHAYDTDKEASKLTPINSIALPSRYFFVKKYTEQEWQATSNESPYYTDTVMVNFRGKLINGAMFDQSYKSKELDPAVAVPVKFPVGGVIAGWTEALQLMKPGERWILYIPSDLAYGSVVKGSIPAFSTLVFDLNLVRFYHPKLKN